MSGGIERQTWRWRVLSKGAEATLYIGSFLGMPAVKKVRHAKRYRDRRLDIKLRTLRTRREARLLVLSKRLGVPTPYLYYVDVDNCVIIMEYVEGVLVRDHIMMLESQGRIEEADKIFKTLGEMLAILHGGGVIHGDYTTSNVIISKMGKLFVIDFGLGVVSPRRDPEDYAVELRVFSRGLEVFHSKYYDRYISSFLDGYRGFKYADDVIERFREIFRRGRYVVERRKRKTFVPK